MQQQQSEVAVKPNLKRNLTIQEQQAFQGAKSFYYCFIPTSMISILCGHLYVLQLYLNKEQSVTIHMSLGDITTSFVMIIISCVSYYLALKEYVRCNEINTTPVLSQLELIEQIKETQITENGENGLLGSKKPPKYVCSKCNITCDYRTKHCKKCQVCIERFDHHCFWIGNCVGRHNHKPFYLFLLYQTVNNTLNFMTLHQLPDYLDKLGSILHPLIDWSIFGMQLFAFGFIIFTGYLLIYHTMLVSNGITTWEHMRRLRINYLKYLPKGYNPFSRGVIENWKNFFGEQTRANGFEIVQSWQADVPTFEESQSLQPVFNLIENEYYSCC